MLFLSTIVAGSVPSSMIDNVIAPPTLFVVIVVVVIGDDDDDEDNDNEDEEEEDNDDDEEEDINVSVFCIVAVGTSVTFRIIVDGRDRVVVVVVDFIVVNVY